MLEFDSRSFAPPGILRINGREGPRVLWTKIHVDRVRASKMQHGQPVTRRGRPSKPDHLILIRRQAPDSGALHKLENPFVRSHKQVITVKLLFEQTAHSLDSDVAFRVSGEVPGI